MHLAGGQPCGGTDGIAIRKFHERPVDIPFILLFIDDHSKQLNHGMVHALDVSVAVRMVGVCCSFAHALELVYSVRQLGEELEALVRVETNGAYSQRGALVGQNVNGTFGRKFGRRNGIHVCAPAETNTMALSSYSGNKLAHTVYETKGHIAKQWLIVSA